MRVKRGADTYQYQRLDFPAPMRCEVSPVAPMKKKHRGPRKPAWIGLVPCVPYVPCKEIDMPTVNRPGGEFGRRCRGVIDGGCPPFKVLSLTNQRRVNSASRIL